MQYVDAAAAKSLSARLIKAMTMILLIAGVVGCAPPVKVGPDAVASLTPDARIEMRQVQVAYMGSASSGIGTINYQGRNYPFKVGGLGVGGIGASTIEAYGEVYKLPNLRSFPGAYAQARYGLAVGSMSAGDLWMQNEAGVILHLKARRTGLMLSLGGDAVLISMGR